MEYKTLFLGVLTIFLLSIGACSLVGQEEDSELVGTVWRLQGVTSLDGEKVYAVRDDQVYAFRLSDNGNGVGQAACNGCGVKYAMSSSDSISIGLGCTEMACFPNSFPYVYAMGSVETYELEGNWLRLYSSELPQWLSHRFDNNRLILYHEAVECSKEIPFCD